MLQVLIDDTILPNEKAIDVDNRNNNWRNLFGHFKRNVLKTSNVNIFTSSSKGQQHDLAGSTGGIGKSHPY